ncbi:MAG: right-handed parallel beta-helix repeat-containing protein [Betaproteobacteria bacterium]|nr:right-handed parallel beta-helix repeat-containing protein [Betaproteobacteria bacterium]
MNWSCALAPLLLAVAMSPAFSVSAATVDTGPSEYRSALSRLMAGDTLRLAPGDYMNGLPVHGLVGTEGAPIRIEASDASRRPRFIARQGHNTVSIVDSAYVEIRQLDIDGLGLAVDAVKAEGHARWAHHITLQGLRIRGHGADQNTVAVSTKCPAWGWKIQGNEIEGAGTALYLGNSDGSAPFFDGVVENNVVRGSIGYNLQIKHQSSRPDPDGKSAGRRLNVIRFNVFVKGSNSSSGKSARPSVLVGHQPKEGAGSTDVHVVYGNVFLGNPSESLFQGEGNIAFYNNILVNVQGSAVAIQPHNRLPLEVEVVGNTIIARDTGVRLLGADTAYRQRVDGNLILARTPVEGIAASGNVRGSLAEANEYLRHVDESLPGLDATPLARLVRDSRGLKWRDPVFPDGDLDYSGDPRVRRVAGAVDERFVPRVSPGR